jgi:hypothetical protein
MNKEDLRFVADALLALCEADHSQPFYTEEVFETKLKRARLRAISLPFHTPMEPWIADDLDRRECEEMLRFANLTDAQSRVLQLRLRGFTFEEIGARDGHTKQNSQRIFVQAIKKLDRSRRVYRYEGLADVYREETRRGVRCRPLR